MGIRTKLLIAMALVSIAGAARGADDLHEEHGAHQHGHGRLNIAIEKQTVVMELEIPASDIVGFEREATTDAERAVLEAAKAKLADPLSLYGIPKAASCTVEAADISYEAAEQGPVSASEGQHPTHHAEFQVQYRLQCADVRRIEALDMAFFATFPRSEELEVFVLAEKGQIKAEATRASPRVALKGIW